LKAIVTMAGEGTRMLPVTKGLRKEMLPLFYVGQNGVPMLAPVAHLVVSSLYGSGARDLTMVVGKDAEAILKYFTPDAQLILRHAHHRDRLAETEALHDLLSRINFTWVVQSTPGGFGDALLAGERSAGEGNFLLHAADAMLLEPSPGHALDLMARLKEKTGASVVLFVRKVKDPRRYGVVEGKHLSPWEGHPVLQVSAMEEKPAKPKSQWAATALYALDQDIFRALRDVRSSEKPRELEVTSGIAALLSEGKKVLAVVSRPSRERWLSVGSPEGYFRSLRMSYTSSLRRIRENGVHAAPSPTRS
jgi:UTP--glucose-1-phosphate uridylyltransferase